VYVYSTLILVFFLVCSVEKKQYVIVYLVPLVCPHSVLDTLNR